MSALGFPENCIDAYLGHVIEGQSLGFLAAKDGNHRSTQLRRVRRIEDLRDNPEWDSIVTQLVTYRRNRSVPSTDPVTRDTICAAFGVTLTELHAAFSATAQNLVCRGYFLAIGSLPKAAVIKDEVVILTVNRELALAALAVGWIMPDGKGGKVRKYTATKAISECFSVPSFTRDEPRSPVGDVHRQTAFHLRRLTPLEFLLTRTSQGPITSDHIRLSQEFHQIYLMRDTAMAVAFSEIKQALPPRTLKILVEVCGKNTGFVAVEKEMELPARSAKAIIAFALDAYDHIRTPA